MLMLITLKFADLGHFLLIFPVFITYTMLPLDTKKCLVFLSETHYFQAADCISRSKEEKAQDQCQ